MFVFRYRRPKKKFLYAPVETLHAVKRREKEIDRYTDKYGVRSDKFIPKHKLPAPRWHWDYDLTQDSTAFIKSVAGQITAEYNQKLNSPFKEDEWPIQSWTPGIFAGCLK